MKKVMKAVAALMLMTAVVCATGCKKDPTNINVNENTGYDKPTVVTTPITDVTRTTAKGGGVITSDAGGEIIERGLCWGKQPNPDVAGDHTIAGIGAGTFICELTDLDPNTTYHVRAYAINSVGVGYGDDLVFATEGYAWVDLGLPSGLLWATCNVGADTPEGYGDYFAWGETCSKTTYNWYTYKYFKEMSSTNEPQLTKYCDNASYGYNGFTDNLTALLPEDDAATANWGIGWRTPKQEEWDELYQNTNNTWTTKNGVNGRLFTASNGNSLFLPAAGYRYADDIKYAGTQGYYWSSSLSYTIFVWYFRLVSGGVGVYSDGYERSCGLTVRPVRSSK